tara:strand:- start:276 stop:1022 length:747 start_codon:yes stop_codon:yes gene_type:complete
MLGLGTSILSPYLADAGYVNSHSLSLDGAGSGSDADFLDTNTTLQAQLRDSFSFSLWVKLDDGRPSTTKYFVGASTSGNIIGFFMSSSGTIGFTHFSNSDIAIYNSNSAVFADGAIDWTHMGVVVTETGGDTGYKLYVNGSEIAGTRTLGVSASNQSQYTSSTNVAFGALNGSTASGGLDGLIDECAFFDDALTDDEMLALGGGGAPTDITGHDHLFLYYKLNNSTTDEVGNSNGSLNGQAAFSTTTP